MDTANTNAPADTQSIIRGAIAVLVLIASVLGAYSGFAWLETIRGRQVYPPGSLDTIIFVAGGGAVLALLAIGWLLRKATFRFRSIIAVNVQSNDAASDVWRRQTFSFASVCAALAISLLFAAFTVRHSLTNGRMAFPPFYDDVGYFDDAMRRLFVFYDSGLRAFVADYYRAAPHSPASTLLAMAGFALFGLNDWAPAFMNFVIVFGILLLTRFLTRDLETWLQVPVYGFLLAWPYLSLSIVHCIPDFLCCAAMAAGAWFIAASPWTMRGARVHFVSGALFGLALLAKPAMYPVTICVFGGAILTAVAWHYSVFGEKGILRGAGIPAMRALIACLAISLPHYLVNWRAVQAYIQINTFGPRKDMWKFEGTASKQFLYYLTGDGGTYAMGPLFWAWILVAILAGVAAYRVRSVNAIRAAIGGAAVLAMTHAVVSVTSYKSVFLGLTIPAFLMISGVAMLAYALGEFRKSGGFLGPAGLILCLFTAAGAAAQFRPQPMMTILAHIFRDYPTKGVAFVREGEYRREYTQALIQLLHDDGRPSLRVGVSENSLFFMPYVFQYQAKKDRTRAIEFSQVDPNSADKAAFLQDTVELDYLATILPATPAAENRLLSALPPADRWQIKARWPAPIDGGEILVLSRSSNWRSVDLNAAHLIGFSGLEGPNPPATFKVRWALGPGFSIPLASATAEKVELVMSSTTTFPHQSMEILLNGKQVAVESIPDAGPYKDMRVPLQLIEGQNTLELKFSSWEKPPAERPLAVLFRQFQILPASESR